MNCLQSIKAFNQANKFYVSCLFQKKLLLNQNVSFKKEQKEKEKKQKKKKQNKNKRNTKQKTNNKQKKKTSLFFLADCVKSVVFINKKIKKIDNK